MAFEADKLTGIIDSLRGQADFFADLRSRSVPSLEAEGMDVKDELLALRRFAMDTAEFLERLVDTDVPGNADMDEFGASLVEIERELSRTRQGNFTVDGKQSVEVTDTSINIILPKPKGGGDDLPTATSSAEEADNESIHHHYSMSQAYGAFPEEVTWYSSGGFLYASVEIALTTRRCEEDIAIGDHPAYRGPVSSGAFSGVARGNIIDTYEGADDKWIELAYSAFDVDGNSEGHGLEAVTDFHIHARIMTDGTLELRSTNDSLTAFSCVITGTVERINYSEYPNMVEFGAGGCHDDTAADGGVWPNNVWTPLP